jgi:predicted TIM-barrel fold metal-dependent hydrolase
MSNAPQRNPNAQLPIREDWLKRRTEDVLEPDLAIVDPHHHLWDRGGHIYFLPQLLEDTGSGHNIVATVFVECRAMYRAGGDPALQPVGEVEFVNGIAAMSASGAYGATKVALGIVGYADLGLGAAVERVLALETAIGGGRFKGVRNISAWHPDPAARGSSAIPPPDVMTRPTFLEGFKVLVRMGLTFDAWLYHTQLGELTALSRAVPEATIVLDHVGGAIGIGPYSGKRDEVFAHWKKGIRELASCQNVNVKLGGLGMRLFGFDVHAGELPPTSEQLATAWRPYIETCIEAFGPARCMFESNFPVDKGACSYQALWNAFKRITAGASAADKAALYRTTAARVYRLSGL